MASLEHATAPKGRAAVLIPSGRIVGRDNVVSFHHGDMHKTIATDANIGDTFVFEATLRLIDYKEIVPVAIGGNVEEMVELLDSCDVAILRGSNYIHPEMSWGQLPRALDASSVPVVAFGIGAQAPRYQDVPISPETERVLNILSDRASLLGCRGAFTAETLGKLGIRNAVPIGCPSLFRLNDRGLQVRMPEADSVKRVAFTIARGMAGMYCDAPGRARVKQLGLLESLSRQYEVYPVTQSEKSEKIYYYRVYERIEEARKLMKDSGWNFGSLPWLEALYWSRIFFGTSPAAYEAMMRFVDIAVGYRLHGNIMALSIGKPAIYHTYDSRTRELVEHFAIPSYDIMSETEFDWDSMLAPDTFDGFNARAPRAYDIMRDFLAANGIRHRMQATPPPG